MSTRRIEIYDTTLRDGTQGEGFNLSLQDKLLIAQKLDELGVDYIEGGFPLSNPKDEAFFRDVRELKLKHAQVAAFGMTRRRGVKAEDDPGMKCTARCGDAGRHDRRQDQRLIRRQKVLNVTLEENLAMIGDSVRLMQSAGPAGGLRRRAFLRRVRANPEYALQTLLAAQEAGASVLCLCDTNGGTMPECVAAGRDGSEEATSATIGIHTHNDSARRGRQRAWRRSTRAPIMRRARSTASASAAATWI